MKKILTFLIAATMIFSLAACGSSNQAQPAPAAASTASSAAESTAPASEASTAEVSEPAAQTASASVEESAPAEEPAAEPAQWPNGDVTVYIPQDAGTPTDVVARILLDYLHKTTGANFIVENDATGGGAALIPKLEAAAPDGQTIMIGATDTTQVNYYQGLYPYNMLDQTSFKYFTGAYAPNPLSGNILLTQPDAPYSNITELVEYVKEHPGEVTCGVVAGKTGETKTKTLLRYLGVLDDVRYVSASQADMTTGLLGGNINLGMLDEFNAANYILSGDLKGIINTCLDREWYRSLPTYTDELLGVLDSVEIFADVIPEEDLEKVFVQHWQYVYVPYNTPDEICDAIQETIAGMQNDQEYMDQVLANGPMNVYYAPSKEETEEHMKILDEQCAAIYSQE